ncbi:putative nuclear transport factor 2 domain protein [Diplodia seriata]|uniref:Putative nuclear transport factor 2 domain protein n=1 Tax=Diplodia seriata TaxID=420778 RepID=A0A0G2GIH9_9PEZI|nr:putative nuclear transport factor 2 domain protein [Diplodia seriata]
MVTPLPLDVQTKVASNVSEAFADAYYTALQAARYTLATFYTGAETLPDGKTVPVIAWNGNVYDSGPAFQDAFADAMPAYTYFEVQSLDAQVLNPNPPPTPPPKDGEADAMIDGGAAPVGGNKGGGGKRGGGQQKEQPEELVGSLLVVVNGFVRLEEKKDGPQKGFSETFVIVPNKNYSKKDGNRRWVVQNQNFRYVV